MLHPPHRPTMIVRCRTIVLTLLLLGGMHGVWAPPRTLAAANLPASISDEAFWGLITELSEPGGFFHSDNFSSNEATFQHVIPELTRSLGTGGAYIGVGPEQNFT